MVLYLRFSSEYSGQCIVLMLFMSTLFSLPLNCHEIRLTSFTVHGFSNGLEIFDGNGSFTYSVSSERRVAVQRRDKDKLADVQWISRHLMTSSENPSEPMITPVQQLSGGEFKDLASCATRKCWKYISQKSCVGKCNSVNYTACSCHSTCVLFNHCCNDFQEVCEQEYENAQEVITQHPGIYAACDSFLGFKVISNCPANSPDIEKKLCLQERNANNGFTVLPVTETNTSLAFKNIFCLMCWNITMNYTFWDAKVDIPKEEMPPNPTLLLILQIMVETPAWVTWRMISKQPMYKCQANAEDYPKNCTAMTLDHPDLGATCLQENSYLVNGSCQGRCYSTTAFPCSCQPQCMLHETCCDDFATTCADNFIKARDEIVQNPNLFTICDKILRISVISHCPDSATKLSKRQCESRDPFVPKTFIPVTDSVTHRQFKNEFCWRCWNMNGQALPWESHAREQLIGYKPSGKARTDTLIYMLENHHLTYWFPKNYLPRHSCSRSTITCLMRQYYQIQPMLSHCSNLSSNSTDMSLHNFPPFSFSEIKPVKDCSCLSSCGFRDSCCEDYEILCGIKDTQVSQIMSSNHSQVMSDNDSQIISDNGSQVMLDTGNQVISDNYSQNMSADDTQKMSDNGSQIISDHSSQVMSENSSQIMSDNGSQIMSDNGRQVSVNGSRIMSDNGRQVISDNGSQTISNIGSQMISENGNPVMPDNETFWHANTSSQNVGSFASLSAHFNTPFVIIATFVFTVEYLVSTVS